MSQDYERSNERPAGRRRAPSHLEGGKGQGGARQEPPRQPQRRRRKKKRAGPLGVVLYLVFVLGLSALLAGVGWVAANDVLALNKPPLEAVVEIGQGATLDDVADLLKENGLIEFKSVFKLFAAFTHAKDDITPGTYELNTEMDYRAIITNISKNSPNRKVAEITIIEGMTVDQIFALLEEKGVSTQAELQEVAANHAFKYSFLQDLPTGDHHRLEGYLFPDTYKFYMGGDPLQILNKMILRFDQMFTEEMRAAAAEKGYSVAEIVTIASMIQKETDDTDQKKIASVIYNRLNNPGAGTNGLLQIDATILYVTGGTKVDVGYETPYNTYKYQGLPPGPISNPGSIALQAALNPERTSYFYYALGDDGLHHFFKTNKGLEDFKATQALYNAG